MTCEGHSAAVLGAGSHLSSVKPTDIVVGAEMSDFRGGRGRPGNLSWPVFRLVVMAHCLPGLHGFRS